MAWHRIDVAETPSDVNLVQSVGLKMKERKANDGKGQQMCE